MGSRVLNPPSAGTAKAAEGAWTLAEAVRAGAGDVGAALAQWEPAQLALGQQVVARARGAGERLQHGRWHIEEPLPFGLYALADSALPGTPEQPRPPEA